MSRVAVITLADFNNYGNRLQNYALERLIVEMGYEVNSIVPYRPNIIKEAVKTVIRKKDVPFTQKWLQLKRLNNFLSFDKRYSRTSSINNNDFCTIPIEDYDCFISGSDQVWNPDWADYTYEKTFLRFCRKEKRIAYAASFGVDSIPKKWIDKYKTGLSEFQYLSVRENKAVEIVEELIGKTCERVLDPTMLLDKDEWNRIAIVPPQCMNKNYILTYFLGGRSDAVNKDILEYARKYDCYVINLLDLNDPNYFVGPDKFVGLISKAKLILTDSFHATVFSIIYERPFVVYNRKGIGSKMGSRLSSLLDMCDLSRRKRELVDETNLFSCDFENAKKKIEQEKIHSMAFLHNAIEACKDSVG